MAITLKQLQDRIDTNAQAIGRLHDYMAGMTTDIDKLRDCIAGSMLGIKRCSDLCCRRESGTGAIVRGHFVPGYPLDYVAYVVPVQDGMGDPSPSNVRPIAGVDALAITQCGEITDSAADEYIGTTYQLLLSTLTDAQGAAIGTQYGGYIDSARGKYVQTHGAYVIDGTEDWTANNTAQTPLDCSRYTCKIINQPKSKNFRPYVCSHYTYNGTDRMGLWLNNVNPFMELHICDEFASVEDLKSYLAAQYAANTPVTVVYELATPIEYDIDNLPEIVANDGVTSLYTDSGDVGLIGGAIDLRWEMGQLRTAIITLIEAYDGLAGNMANGPEV